MLVCLLAVAACHGGAKSGTTPTGGGGGGGDDGGGGGGGSGACEPGRCLPDIAKQISAHRDETRGCFDIAKASNDKLKGRLIINFRIDKNGEVTETSQGMQDDQIQDEGLVSCISEIIKKVKFPASTAGKATRAYHQFEFGTH
jgi:hypothetical protein